MLFSGWVIVFSSLKSQIVKNVWFIPQFDSNSQLLTPKIKVKTTHAKHMLAFGGGGGTTTKRHILVKMYTAVLFRRHLDFEYKCKTTTSKSISSENKWNTNSHSLQKHYIKFKRVLQKEHYIQNIYSPQEDFPLCEGLVISWHDVT